MLPPDQLPLVPDNETLLSRVMPFLVAALTFAVFLPALKNGFVSFDDPANLLENLNYRGLGWEQLKWMFTTFHTGPYQPLSWITLGLDYLIWGMNPFGYHLTSVILHCLNALVFYLICARLLPLTAGAGAADRGPGLVPGGRALAVSACFAALFFALHPLRVESVAWATERRDVLSGLFYLLAVLWYIIPRSPGGEGAPFWRRLLLPLTAFILALLSKGMTVSLPVTLLALDIYPLRRLPFTPRLWFSGETRRVWLEKVPFLAIAALFSLTGYLGQATVDAGIAAGQFGPVHRALLAVIFYPWKTLVPLDLSPFYQFPAPGGFGRAWLLLFPGAAAAAITAVVIALRRRWPAGPVLWINYLAVLSPTLGIIQFGHQPVADRYAYLPCLGFALLAGAAFRAGLQAAARPLRIATAALACLILGGAVFLTWRQEKIWRDPETLLRHALAVNPEIDFAQNGLGDILAARGEPGKAVAHYLAAVKINPRYYEAYTSMGGVLAGHGRPAEAVKSFQQALKIKPDHAEAHNNLGIALSMQGRNGEAEKRLLEALRLDPGLYTARNNLGVILAGQGRFRQAVAHFREALRIKPGSALAHKNLGGALDKLGKHEEAVVQYGEALRLDPDYAEARLGLENILKSRNRRMPVKAGSAPDRPGR